jgi:hypothetical protein
MEKLAKCGVVDFESHGGLNSTSIMPKERIDKLLVEQGPDRFPRTAAMVMAA